MSHQALDFEITDKVGVHSKLARRRAIISCETKDGKSIHLEADRLQNARKDPR